MARTWHSNSMARIRVSTTVDESLLADARAIRPDSQDSTLLDEALGAFLAQNRRAQIDASYAAYDDQPIDTTDEWGDLATWGRAARNS